MSTLAVTEPHAELVRLAWRANANPDEPAPDGEAFGQLRIALRNRDMPAARRALEELAPTRRRPGRAGSVS